MQGTARARPGSSVAVLAYDGMSAFETGIVTEVFGLQWPELDVAWYDLRICTEQARGVRMLGGARLQTPHGLTALADAQTVIIPSVADVQAQPSARLTAALRAAHDRHARIVSICTGAFALAAAGLLDGRRATTHWQHADLLAQRYPAVRVDADPLYVDEGDVLTSAGCAAGIDLCLHLVRTDYGPTIANAVARRLVTPPHRDGGQAQYIETPVARGGDDDPIGHSIEWTLDHLADPVSIRDLAGQAHMSPRTYLRRFTARTGISPMRWLVRQRVHASLAHLEASDLAIETIARTVGFDTAITYRHHFRQVMRTSPTTYRRTFRHPGRNIAADG